MKNTKQTAEEIAQIEVEYTEVKVRGSTEFNEWMRRLKNNHYSNNEEMLKAFDKFNEE
jgi:hypothetical protein